MHALTQHKKRAQIKQLFAFAVAFVMLNLVPMFVGATIDPALQDIKLKTPKEHINASKELMATDLKKALIEAQLAISRASVNSPEVQIEALSQAATVCFYIGLYDKAAEQWLKAISIAESEAMLEKANRLKFNVVGLYMAMGEYDKAYETIKPIITFFDSAAPDVVFTLSDKHAIQNNLAIIYGALFPDSALTKFRSVIAFTRQNDLTKKLNTSQQAMLTFLVNTEDWVRADSLATVMAVDIEENAFDYAALLHKRGSIAAGMGDTAAFLKYMISGIDLAEQIGAYGLTDYFAERLSQYYKSVGDAEQALYYAEIREQLAYKDVTHSAQALLSKSEYEHIVAAVEARAAKDASQGLGWQILLVVTAIISFMGLLLAFLNIKNKDVAVVKDDVDKSTTTQGPSAILGQDQALATINVDQGTLSSQQDLLQLRDKLLKETIEVLKQGEGQQNSGGLSRSGLRALQNFDLRIQEIDSSFFKTLQEKYPHLTPNERRLCVLLKMDMSTKDVVVFTGQTLRAVEIARTRLRKKLGIDNTQQNLNAFLRSI